MLLISVAAGIVQLYFANDPAGYFLCSYVLLFLIAPVLMLYAHWPSITIREPKKRKDAYEDVEDTFRLLCKYLTMTYVIVQLLAHWLDTVEITRVFPPTVLIILWGTAAPAVSFLICFFVDIYILPLVARYLPRRKRSSPHH